jgi:ATP-dependent DNA helicase RecG
MSGYTAGKTMTEERILHLLQQGEGMSVEFKEAAHSLPQNTFETICAFLNREGGTLLLGVDDAGHVLGIAPEAELVNRKQTQYSERKIFPNAYPATFTIYSDRVEVKNACVAHGYGPIDPLTFFSNLVTFWYV